MERQADNRDFQAVSEARATIALCEEALRQRREVSLETTQVLMDAAMLRRRVHQILTRASSCAIGHLDSTPTEFIPRS